jgi:hypothetical protein
MAATRRILVIYYYPVPLDNMRLAIKQHLLACESGGTKTTIQYHNVYENTGRPHNLNYDAVILHTTFLCLRWSPLFYQLKWELRWIKELSCIKVALPQDEYDHSEILDEWLFEWDVSVIFCCFDHSLRKILYPLMFERAQFFPALTGYIKDDVASRIRNECQALEPRVKHVIYRASQLPYWFGSHGQLKHRIAGIVADEARRKGLICDISTRNSDTITGEAWLDFMASGKVVIGCESGSSVLDRRGEIQAQIKAILQCDPTLTFEHVSSQLLAGWDSYSFFAISPRHLEAVITQTCQVLVEGSYSGILHPDLHYIPLKRDFSNLDDVLEKTRNTPLIQEMVGRAYTDICLSGKYSYRAFASQIEQAISV